MFDADLICCLVSTYLNTKVLEINPTNMLNYNVTGYSVNDRLGVSARQRHVASER
jgi:hypothetical protein